MSAFADPVYGEIAPGEIGEPNRGVGIIFNQNCPDSVFARLRVDIYSGEIVYWSEAISIFVTKAPSGLGDKS